MTDMRPDSDFGPTIDLTAALDAASPDTALSHSIRHRLDAIGYHQLRNVHITVDQGHVRLSGKVGRYYLLQVAQNAVMTTDGVRGVASEIEIVRG